MGPHSNGDSGIYVSSRELARFGYLALHNGVWDGQQLIPAWWMDLATKASQPLNSAYGYTWWVNSEGTMWSDLPGMADLCAKGLQCEPLLCHPVAGSGRRAGWIGPGRVV